MNGPQLDGPLHHLQRLLAIAEGADAHLVVYRGCQIEADMMAAFFGLVVDETRAAMAALQDGSDGSDGAESVDTVDGAARLDRAAPAAGASRASAHASAEFKPFNVDAGTLTLASSMTPGQARAVASALCALAGAAEAVGAKQCGGCSQ